MIAGSSARGRFVRALTLGSLAAALAVGATASPASARDDADTRVASWDAAAATLGTAGSLWEPAWTADLERSARIRVIADRLTFSDAGVTGGDTTAAARYGDRRRGFTLAERWAGTGWAAEPAFTTSTAKVGRVTIRLGSPGMRIGVPATVYADCADAPRTRCTRADVLRTGGYLVMTARPASTMTEPGRTALVITTSGLTYRELLDIAGSLQQVAGTPTVAGSAQMVGMCRQMVDSGMDVATATSFATSLGYQVRVGSIDGEPLALTLDYRPDRFTVSVVGGPAGTVTGCTYG